MKKKEQRIQDNILFLGNRDDVYRLYQAMDVFVLPSRYEGLPVVGVEAQAAGLSCVLSDHITGDIGITDAVQFCSIEQGPLAWAVKILEKASERRKEAQGKLLQSGFSISKQANMLESYYMDILAGRESK